MTGKRAEPRVAFVSLIDCGLMKPGTMLYDAKQALGGQGARRRHAGDRRRAGSIHRIGAEVQGLDACNGWTFWHYERNGGLTQIDELAASPASAWSAPAPDRSAFTGPPLIQSRRDPETLEVRLERFGVR